MKRKNKDRENNTHRLFFAAVFASLMLFAMAPTSQSNAKKYVKPALLILTGVIIAFLLIGLFGGVSATVCEDSKCFIEEANNCDQAIYAVTDEVGTFNYFSKDCAVIKELISFNEGENPGIVEILEGKNMVCNYEKGSFDSDIVDSLILGTENCEGELSEILPQLLIFTIE